MIDLEKQLREVMRSHDQFAPSTASFRFSTPTQPRLTRHARTSWVASSAAAVCVLLVAVGVWVSRQDHHESGTASGKTTVEPSLPLASCPGEFGPFTDAVALALPQPATGFAASERLVPNQTPTRAVLCSYLHTSHGALTGLRTMTAGLSKLGAELASLPRTRVEDQPCATYATATDFDTYLLGLSYPKARVWIAIPGNHCSGASNGSIEVINLRIDAEAAYRTGAWPN
ncbi:MAG: hypothetical protein QOK11_3316 [Pseudonocardiales bacterium]|nr:hypothetical protein [Pseudonocardiales bacterium]